MQYHDEEISSSSAPTYNPGYMVKDSPQVPFLSYPGPKEDITSQVRDQGIRYPEHRVNRTGRDNREMERHDDIQPVDNRYFDERQGKPIQKRGSSSRSHHNESREEREVRDHHNEPREECEVRDHQMRRGAIMRHGSREVQDQKIKSEAMALDPRKIKEVREQQRDFYEHQQRNSRVQRGYPGPDPREVVYKDDDVRQRADDVNDRMSYMVEERVLEKHPTRETIHRETIQRETIQREEYRGRQPGPSQPLLLERFYKIGWSNIFQFPINLSYIRIFPAHVTGFFIYYLFR